MLKFFIATLACALILNDVNGQFVPITRTQQQPVMQQQQQPIGGATFNPSALTPEQILQIQQFILQQKQQQQQVPTTTVAPVVVQSVDQSMITQRLQDQLKAIQQQQQQKLQTQQVQQQNLLQQLQQFEGGRPQSNQLPAVEQPQRVQFQSVQGVLNNTVVRVPTVQQVQQVQHVPVVQQVQQVPKVQQVQQQQQFQQQFQQFPKVQQQVTVQSHVTGVSDDVCVNAQPGDLIAHPTDASQFIICYGFGEFTVMDCPEMLVYNAHLRRCDVNTELPMLCKSNPCLNGGRCVEVSSIQFKCECSAGFGGQLCDKLDTCATRPCGADGVCIPFVLGSPVAHVCLCNGGRAIGPSCQRTEPNPCLQTSSNLRLLPVALNPSVFAHCEGSRPHFKFCTPPLVFSAAKQECEWA